MRLTAELTTSAARDDRRAERRPVAMAAGLRRQGANRVKVEVLDLSTHGFRTESPNQVAPGAIVWLGLPGLAPLQARVAWFRDYQVGCAFVAPLHPAVLGRILAAGEPGERL